MRLQSQIDCTTNIDNNMNTLAGDWRQGILCHACANWSAQSPEVVILNETTYAGSLPYASATLRCMRQGSQGLWRCVHCNKNSAGVNQAGYPNLGTRRRSTIKVNARCFTVVSAVTQYWHTKFRHVRYVWFGESLQKHSKFIANLLSQVEGSQQWSH